MSIDSPKTPYQRRQFKTACGVSSPSLFLLKSTANILAAWVVELGYEQERPRRKTQRYNNQGDQERESREGYEKEDWTYDWRHKDSFNNADQAPGGVGALLVSSATKRGLCTILLQMPACPWPPLHMANPNVPQSLEMHEGASLAPSRSRRAETPSSGTAWWFSWCMYS